MSKYIREVLEQPPSRTPLYKTKGLATLLLVVGQHTQTSSNCNTDMITCIALKQL